MSYTQQYCIILYTKVGYMHISSEIYSNTHFMYDCVHYVNASDWLLRLSRLGFVLFGHAYVNTGFLMMMFILHVPIMLLLRVFDAFQNPRAAKFQMK